MVSCRKRGEGVISAVGKCERRTWRSSTSRGGAAQRCSLPRARASGQLGADTTRRKWRLTGPHFLGHVVHHCVADPRDGKTLLAAARTGHLGPTIFRSADRGRTWHEAKRPPAFREGSGRAVDHSFWLAPGHAGEPKTWYAGTSPQGLFRSEDGGATWDPFSAINDDPQYRKWMGTTQDGTPDGPKLHSIIVDPRDPAHLYFAMSGGGVHESVDCGQTWTPIVAGLEVVEGFDA